MGAIGLGRVASMETLRAREGGIGEDEGRRARELEGLYWGMSRERRRVGRRAVTPRFAGSLDVGSGNHVNKQLFPALTHPVQQYGRSYESY